MGKRETNVGALCEELGDHAADTLSACCARRDAPGGWQESSRHIADLHKSRDLRNMAKRADEETSRETLAKCEAHNSVGYVSRQ
jgi:hypothetical protein